MSVDPRDTNHDGKVSLVEKVKDKVHHKNTTTTHTTTTAALPLATTGVAAAPITGAVPIIGYVAVPLAVTGAAVPLATTGIAAPLTTGAAYTTTNTAYDSRDLNRDGVVSMTEKLASTHIGAHQTEEARLTLHEEQLSISKREVGAGEVDIHKRVHEQHVSQTVAVRREEVIVERRPLSGVADPNYRISSQDETMRVPLFREEIVTEKRVVPTEEVIVRKKEVVDQQTVGATLRSEHVETVQTTHTHSSTILDTNNSSMMSSNIVGSSQLAGVHDARDTNFDGKVSLGEKVKGAVAGNKGPVIDSRDLNKDGKVSTSEKVKAAARG